MLPHPLHEEPHRLRVPLPEGRAPRLRGVAALDDAGGGAGGGEEEGMPFVEWCFLSWHGHWGKKFL